MMSAENPPVPEKKRKGEPRDPAESQSASMTAGAAPPARLGSALRSGLRAVWDRLGLVIAMSLTWSVLASFSLTLGRLLPASLPTLLRLGITALIAVAVLAAPTAGVFTVAYLISAREEASYIDFWRGGITLLGPAVRLALIQLAVLIMFVVNLWFYVPMGHTIGSTALVIGLYAFVFWSLMAVYHWPLLVAQERGLFDAPEHRARRGAVAVLRRAFFLVLGSPGFSLGLLLALAILSALLFATLALPALLWIGAVGLLSTQALRALLVRYEVLPPPVVEAPIPDEKFRIQAKRSLPQEEQAGE
jgi:hypothetical protein